MSPLRFRRLLVAKLAAALLLGCSGDPGPPNVLLISIDTLRPDHLSTYGYERDTSPNIDRFAAESMLFENAFSQSPKTAPSHMSLMTGLYPEAHKVMNFEEGGGRLADSVPTMAELFARAGYKARAVTSGGNVRGSLGFDRGFESYEQHILSVKMFPAGRKALAEVAEHRNESGQPFFLFLHTYQVHDPYLSPPAYVNRYTDPNYQGRIPSDDSLLRKDFEGLPVAKRRNYLSERNSLFWKRVRKTDADRDQLTALYDAGIRFTDEWFGSVLDTLEESGVADETVVVLLSDHGEAFLEHRKWRHSDVYDEVLRIPLIMRVPGGSEGARIGNLVRMVDVLPTVLELGGVEAALETPGRSLVKLFRGEVDAPREVFSQWRDHGYVALRRGDFKYIRRTRGRQELYDMAKDPRELRDLAKKRPADTAKFEAAVRKNLNQARKLQPDPAQTQVELDADARAELEALGYLE